jgi:hypothetical protein
MVSKSRHLLSLLLAFIALVLVAIAGGCGSSDGDTGATVSKASFIRQADAVCSNSDKAQEAKLTQLGQEVKQGDTKPLDDEELILQAGLPSLRNAIEELSALPLPEDGGKAEALIEELEAALEETEQSPKLLLEEPSPFTPVAAKARAYGFKVCGNP